MEDEFDLDRFDASRLMSVSGYAAVASAWLSVYYTHIDRQSSELVEYYEDAVRYGIVFG